MYSTHKSINQYINILTLVVCIVCKKYSYTQPTTIITTKKAYKQVVRANKNAQLINLKELIPNLQLDLRYATTNNFTATNLYTKPTTTYLCKPAATALQLVAIKLLLQQLGLHIFDAYRPYSSSVTMWNLIKDERYVANPASGSNHNRGLSVDLTLYSLTTGLQLPMGTSFDNFTDSAHHAFTPKLTSEIQRNRELLKSTMLIYGFKPLDTEWWHYTYTTKDKYEVIDLPFKTLKKMIK